MAGARGTDATGLLLALPATRTTTAKGSCAAVSNQILPSATEKALHSMDEWHGLLLAPAAGTTSA